MAISEYTITAPAAPVTGESLRSMAPDASRRLGRLVGFFRLSAAVMLLAVSVAVDDTLLLDQSHPLLFRSTAALWGVLAIGILLYQARHPNADHHRVLALLVLDITATTLLVYSGGGIVHGTGGLLVVFVGAAALTIPGRYAFFAASLATLAVLGEQMLAYSQNQATAGDFLGAGILGAVIFAITAAAFPLARRLEESEALAHQRGVDLANLAQLNEYIVQNLRESIVVVDATNHVRLINEPATVQLCGPGRVTGLPLSSISSDLARLLDDWRHGGSSQTQLPGFRSADGSTQINSYIAPIEGRQDGPVLIFLEDAGLLAERVQQSKLAALGRLTASIAHEIRNPVGAISHAGQLLEEATTIGADEQRLLGIIRTNSRRVSGIVDNILHMSRREASKPQMLWLQSWSNDFVAEFITTMELPESRLVIGSRDDLEVRMDPGHLHQILWNLCENAVRHGGNGNTAIEISWGRMPGSRRPYLEVADRGPGIAPELRDRVFEPFATGRKGGTGLGLFISRELAECNRAALFFEPREEGGSIFRLVFADPTRWGG